MVILLEHFKPFPKYPGLHMHAVLPLESIPQVAKGEHICFLEVAGSPEASHV